MATVEIELPCRRPASRANSRGTVASVEHDHNFEDANKSMDGADPPLQLPLLKDTPIIYHYLTFETQLPSPSGLEPIRDGSNAPEPPDLRASVSPFTWSKPRKDLIIWLSCASTVTTAYTAGSYSSASDQMSEYWDVSPVAIYVGITTFTVGFSVAPMFLAPFSELNGRKPVFVATGILFVVSQLCCAVTRSYPGMLVARFFAGVGGSTFSTMVGGVVSDIYHSQVKHSKKICNHQSSEADFVADRNTPMALFSGAAFLGTGLGPLCSGFIAQHLSWRWVFYVQVIDCGLIILLVMLFFKETRGSVLLSRRAKALNSWYEAREQKGLVGFDMPIEVDGKKRSQRIRWKVKSDEERESIGKMIGISVYRPFCK